MLEYPQAGKEMLEYSQAGIEMLEDPQWKCLRVDIPRSMPYTWHTAHF